MHSTKVLPKKWAMFTDIHFGKKSNSAQHNQDCYDFVKWFCEQTRKNKCTHVAFLGDWFENRNAVNVFTLNTALDALRELNNLGVPVYIIVGNHDLYHRESRKVFSTKVFEELEHIILVNEPIVVDDTLICPFLFKNEYSELVKYNNLKYWMGHFEFRNFVITGMNRMMEHGPEHTAFDKPTYIFSGHFHKRQARDNVVFIGNTFPMDYGDAGDDDRGMAFLDTSTDEVWFEQWEDAPSYRRTKLSAVLNGEIDFPSKCRVRCVVDTEILYSEAQSLKEEMTKELGLREFSLEEGLDKKDALSGTEDIGDFDLSSLNTAVVEMLRSGITATSTISADRLIDIYSTL